MRFRVALLVFILLGLTLEVQAQKPLTRDEKLAQKIRVEFLKVTSGIQVPTFSADSLLAARQSGRDTSIILIDVRDDAEIAVSRIEGALSPAEFAVRFRVGGPPKTKTLVAYCTIGYRSGKFAEQLAAQGFKVFNLEGGLLSWVQKGGTVVRRQPDGRTVTVAEVHVYSKEWNLLPPGYQAKW
jgi:rhodanese-related sulfurtransferase